MDLSGGGRVKKNPHEAHTGDEAQSNVVGLWERVLVRSKTNDDKKSRFLVGWALGHKDALIITLMEDGSVRNNISWKCSPEGRSVANDHELQTALGKMKNTKPKVQDCLACEHGINVNLVRKHTFDGRPSRERELAHGDGKVLKRHERGGGGDRRGSKRVRFTHKQPDRRADLELNDDTAAKRAKLFDTPSSSSSSIDVALHAFA